MVASIARSLERWAAESLTFVSVGIVVTLPLAFYMRRHYVSAFPVILTSRSSQSKEAYKNVRTQFDEYRGN